MTTAINGNGRLVARHQVERGQPRGQRVTHAEGTILPFVPAPRPEGTNQSRTDEELAQRLRACQTVFAAVAHDLRSPLASLTLWSETLEVLAPRLATGGDEAAMALFRTAVEQIDTLVRRSVQLVDDVLDISRLEAGHLLPLAAAEVDLVGLARQVLHARPETSDAGHAVRLESAQAELWGWWDGDRLGRVLDNLLTNAIKYSPTGQPIIVRVAQEEGPDGERWAILQVHDRGIGIPAADVGRVFEAYERGRNVTPSMPGTGLGLWLCSQVVHQHGGTLSVASRECAGSTFTVRLPLRPHSCAFAR